MKFAQENNDKIQNIFNRKYQRPQTAYKQILQQKNVQQLNICDNIIQKCQSILSKKLILKSEQIQQDKNDFFQLNNFQLSNFKKHPSTHFQNSLIYQNSIRDIQNKEFIVRPFTAKKENIKNAPQNQKKEQIQTQNFFPSQITIQSKDFLKQENTNVLQLKEIIGKGSFGIVKLGINTKNNEKYAVKIYDKFSLLDPEKKKNVQREVYILNSLCHKNIIKLHQTVNQQSSICLIMEYISQTSLKQQAHLFLINGFCIEEKQARVIFKQLTLAVQQIHKQNIIHRDLKLENIMIDCQQNIKLIDFGCAIISQNNTKLSSFCGTPIYMCPEISRKENYFGKPADIWSLGVILYVLLCGSFPFKGKDDQDLFKKIQIGKYQVKKQLSVVACRLIGRMLNVNPKERIGVKDILEDLWFQL